ncbi:hypothetical protein [Serratia fonticola]|uniref:hypothetical protein n=1 Tax=Serratia fonticola TaxID=47917 RepID=UPI003AB0E796
MDKQTESREQFETWVAFQIGHTIEYVKGQRAATTDRYYNEYIDIPYQAWKASRESLVVELPKREAFESYPHESYMIDDDDGKYIPYAETVESLRAIGIRIKGEGV